MNGITCGRCVVKLHGPGRYFLCRRCYRFAHASQSEVEKIDAHRFMDSNEQVGKIIVTVDYSIIRERIGRASHRRARGPQGRPATQTQ